MARALLLVAGLVFRACLEAAGNDATEAACSAEPGDANGHCSADGTGGLGLLQGQRPQMGKIQLHETERWCTQANGDVYGWGFKVPCCGGLKECLDFHGRNHRHYRCLASCSGPAPAPPTPRPAACTPANQDPWASGSQVPCCSGLERCMDLHGSDRHHYRCLPSCGGGAATPAPAPGPSPDPVGLWRTSGATVGHGWCRAQVPAPGWTLKGSCSGPTQLSVLSYNLYWWNLYGRRGGNGNSAGRLIKHNGPFDILGFQECDDIGRILRDAGLGNSHQGVAGGHATAIAFMKSKWELLASNRADVAEDRREQYYGRRGVGWVRLRHRGSGQVVFFLNHHGPLPVNTGGQCGGQATGYNMLRVIGENAKAEDVKLLLGDINADKNSATQGALGAHMYRLADDWVDAVFSSCSGGAYRNLGKGGSDHNALKVTLQI